MRYRSPSTRRQRRTPMCRYGREGDNHHSHPTNDNHNGGTLAFGADGYSTWPPAMAEPVTTLRKCRRTSMFFARKMLRIDIDVPNDKRHPYLIPPTNPFASTAGADRSLLWPSEPVPMVVRPRRNTTRSGWLTSGRNLEEVEYYYEREITAGAFTNVRSAPASIRRSAHRRFMFRRSFSTARKYQLAMCYHGGYVYRGTQEHFRMDRTFTVTTVRAKYCSGHGGSSCR